MVFEFEWIKNSVAEVYGHPSSKSLPLISYLISLSSKRGDKILDGFLGSGSTLVAAEEMCRTCYGIELEPKYVDVTVERYKLKNAGEITVERGGKQLSIHKLSVD